MLRPPLGLARERASAERAVCVAGAIDRDVELKNPWARRRHLMSLSRTVRTVT
jgi:hypothetical protein